MWNLFANEPLHAILGHRLVICSHRNGEYEFDEDDDDVGIVASTLWRDIWLRPLIDQFGMAEIDN